MALTSSLLASFRLQTSSRVFMRIVLVAEWIAPSSDIGSGDESSSSSLSIRIGVLLGWSAMLSVNLHQQTRTVMMWQVTYALRLFILLGGSGKLHVVEMIVRNTRLDRAVPDQIHVIGLCCKTKAVVLLSS